MAYAGADAGGVIAHTSVLSDMVDRHDPDHGFNSSVHDEPRHVAEPPERPSTRAQWDEVGGHWIEWDAATAAWVRVG